MSKAKLDLGKFLSGGRAAQQSVDAALEAHGRERGGTAAPPAVFHLKNCYLQVLDDGVYLHAEDDHYSGKLDAVDALALAQAITAIVKGSSRS